MRQLVRNLDYERLAFRSPDELNGGFFNFSILKWVTILYFQY
jgi:hypothetical protein